MRRWRYLTILILVSMFGPLLFSPAAAVQTTNTTNTSVTQEQVPTAGHCAGEILNPWFDGGGGIAQEKLSPRDTSPRSGHRTWGSAWLPFQWPAAGSSSCSNGSTLTSTQTDVSEPQQKLIFGDGFNVSPNLVRWNGQRGMVIQSKEFFGDTGAAVRATTTGSPRVLQERFAKAYPALYYRVRFKIVSLGSNSVNLLRFRTAYNDAIVGLYVSSAGRLGVRSDITGDSTTSATLVTKGEWHEARDLPEHQRPRWENRGLV